MENVSPASTGVEVILRRILASGQRLLDLTKGPASHCLYEKPEHTPTLRLPEPPDIIPVLIAAGAHHAVASEIHKAYYKRACELKGYHEAAFTRIRSQSSHLTSSCTESSGRKLLETFTQIYLRHLQVLKAEGITVLKERLKSKIPLPTGRENERQFPRSFNHEYVPLLEHFFKENPFPSHADKVFLAKKSGMSYRQIHVWFQNRRNRTKKEGKVLRRKPMGEGAVLPLDTLYQTMARYTLSGTRLHCAEQKHTSEDELNPMKSIPPCQQPDQLDTTAPPHAFPTIYPPSCLHNPFPLEPRSDMFTKLPWFRKPSTVLHSSSCAIDVSELVELFSQLHVRDDSSRRSRLSKPDTSAATVSITYQPPSAPLPAFIPQKETYAWTRLTNVPLPAIAAPSHQLSAFKSPSPNSPPATLFPSTQTNGGLKLRKMAPLPRRAPHSTRVTQREAVASEPRASASSPSPTISSRTSSSSFDGRRSSDTDCWNYTSPSSDDLFTPESSPSRTQLQCLSSSADFLGFSYQDLISHNSDYCSTLLGTGMPLQLGLLTS